MQSPKHRGRLLSSGRLAHEASGTAPLADSTVGLLPLASQGNGEAVSALLERMRPFLTRIGHGRLPGWARGRAETDDLVQESLIRAVRHIPRFQSQTPRDLRNWLHTVFKNLVIDETRYFKRTGVPQELREHVPDDAVSPEARAVEQEQADVFEIALQGLSARDRQLVVLRLQHGYSFQELADRFGKTPDAVRMAYNRALKRFRDEVRRLIADPSARQSCLAVRRVHTSARDPTRVVDTMTVRFEDTATGSVAASSGRRVLAGIGSIRGGGERSGVRSAPTFDRTKLTDYLDAFDALDPQHQTAWLKFVEDSLNIEQIAESDETIPTPEAAGALVSDAVKHLTDEVFGESTRSESLDALIEATTRDPTALESGDDFERRTLRELFSIAQVVPHRLRLQTTETQTATSQSWGEFTILATIDSGGFGTVYRAWDPTLKRAVALKLYHPHPRLTKADLRGEAEKLAQVNHPNVVAVYGVGEHVLEGSGDTDSRVGLWMELVPGKTLRSWAVRQAKSVVLGRPASAGEDHPGISLDQAVDVGIAVCEALEAMHTARFMTPEGTFSQGIIHGDIKAHNIMIPDGRADRLKVMDFGAAKFRDPDLKESKRTLAGTRQYMAPELFKLERPTVASDIYALGVLLFYLVTGQYPVKGDTGEEVHRAHQTGEKMLTLKEARPKLPEAFAKVVERRPGENSRATFRVGRGDASRTGGSKAHVEYQRGSTRTHRQRSCRVVTGCSLRWFFLDQALRDPSECWH